MKLSKEKRDKLILVAVGTVAAVFGLWYVLITAQQASLKNNNEQAARAQDKVKDAKRRIERIAQIQSELESTTQRLKSIEDEMAPADKYSWFIQLVTKFRAPYRLEKLSFSREQIDDVKLVPEFPYRAATFSIRGAAYYHDLGRFLADFENNFPYVAVQNLEMGRQVFEAAAITNLEETEKLTFKLDVVTLIKPTATP